MRYHEFSKNIERASKYSKSRYVLIKVVLQRFMFFAVVFNIIDIVVDISKIREPYFFVVLLSKFIAILIVGIPVGIMEWKFYELMKNNSNLNISKARNIFIFNYGLLSWGLTIGIANIRYPLISVVSMITVFMVWIICGLFIGLVMWSISSDAYKRYIISKAEVPIQN